MENFENANLVNRELGKNEDDGEFIDSPDAEPSVEVDEMSPEGRRAFELTETAEELLVRVSDMMANASIDVNDLPDLSGIKDELEMTIKRLRDDDRLTQSDVMAREIAIETLTGEVKEIASRNSERNRLAA